MVDVSWFRSARLRPVARGASAHDGRVGIRGGGGRNARRRPVRSGFPATLAGEFRADRKGGAAPGGIGHDDLYGVTDLHGNVWEWVEDFNSVMFPVGAGVDEGSRWLLACGGETLDATSSGDHAAYNRFAIRASIRGAFTSPQLGFRCALTPAKDPP